MNALIPGLPLQVGFFSEQPEQSFLGSLSTGLPGFTEDFGQQTLGLPPSQYGFGTGFNFDGDSVISSGKRPSRYEPSGYDNYTTVNVVPKDLPGNAHVGMYPGRLVLFVARGTYNPTDRSETMFPLHMVNMHLQDTYENAVRRFEEWAVEFAQNHFEFLTFDRSGTVASEFASRARNPTASLSKEARTDAIRAVMTFAKKHLPNSRDIRTHFKDHESRKIEHLKTVKLAWGQPSEDQSADNEVVLADHARLANRVRSLAKGLDTGSANGDPAAILKHKGGKSLADLAYTWESRLWDMKGELLEFFSADSRRRDDDVVSSGSNAVESMFAQSVAERWGLVGVVRVQNDDLPDAHVFKSSLVSHPTVSVCPEGVIPVKNLWGRLFRSNSVGFLLERQIRNPNPGNSPLSGLYDYGAYQFVPTVADSHHALRMSKTHLDLFGRPEKPRFLYLGTAYEDSLDIRRVDRGQAAGLTRRDTVNPPSSDECKLAVMSTSTLHLIVNPRYF